MRSIIEKGLDLDKLASSGKRLRVGAVSFQTGEYRTGNEKSKNIIDWIMASSAFPIFFPMPEIDGQNWTDGGVRETAPLHDAIKLGATEIDVILTSPLNTKKVKDNRIIPQILRVIDLMTKEIMINDLFHDSSIHDKVKIRIIVPKEHLPFESLDFEPKEIIQMYIAEYEFIEDVHKG